MNRIHVFVYHSIYWIYRVLNTWAFTYFLYGEKWYRGATVVQLVLMPFFYLNYALLIPALIAKKYTKYLTLSALWILIFIWVYANWTIYQRHLLYGEAIALPDYIETLNNLIYIWLISTCFCLFEFWIKDFKKNQQLALDRKNHLLRSEENRMLNYLLFEYLNELDKKEVEEIPDKVLLISDFFKYVLYSRDKRVSLETELNFLKQYEQFKNAKVHTLNIYYPNTDQELFIRSTQLISLVNRLVMLCFTKEVLDITIDLNQQHELLLSFAVPKNAKEDHITNAFGDLTIKQDTSKAKFTIVIKTQHNKSFELQTN